jgi:hypothetical protein
MANAESVPPRAVPTDVGVTREHPPLQPGQAPAKPRAAIFAAAAFVSLLIGGAGVVVVKSHPSAAGTATVGPDLPGPIVKPTTPVVSTAVAMTTLAPPAPPAPPSAESASASASASPKPPVRPVVNPQAASPATPTPPRQLGDLKFH